jgi:hypothetical protein
MASDHCVVLAAVWLAEAGGEIELGIAGGRTTIQV